MSVVGTACSHANFVMIDDDWACVQVGWGSTRPHQTRFLQAADDEVVRGIELRAARAARVPVVVVVLRLADRNGEQARRVFGAASVALARCAVKLVIKE